MRVEVVVSHPAKQGNVYHRPLAAQEAGLATSFITGMYVSSETLARIQSHRYVPARAARLLERRNQPGLQKSSVTVLPQSIIAESIFRPLKKIYAWDQMHDLFASWHLRRYQHTKTAVVHGFQGSCLRTLQAARRLGWITLYEVTQPKPEGPAHIPELRSGRDLLRREIGFADYILSQSPFSTEWLISTGVPPSRILDSPLGVDTDLYTPRKTSAAGPFRGLFVGRIQERKGVEILLQAWEQLALPNAELVIVGKVSQNELERLKAIPRQCRVTFTGFVPLDELLNYYRSSDILIMPSYSEGACNVLYEGLACGLPCVVSESARSIVRGECEGLIFQPGDASGLAACISRLHHDSALRLLLAARARIRALEFSWAAYRESLGSIYRALLCGHTPMRWSFESALR